MTLGQKTYIPDDNFENALINLGLDNIFDDSVSTNNISNITQLNVAYNNILDLTGIEDFISLTHLWCFSNHLTSLDISNLTLLTLLNCDFNQLTTLELNTNINLENLYCSHQSLSSLNIMNNQLLIELDCHGNQISSLDLSNNNALTLLDCSYNQLTNLDLSNNTALIHLSCRNNQLTSLDIRTGNNTNMTYFTIIHNYNLNCINVDNEVWSSFNWTLASGNIDSQHYFSINCPPIIYGCIDSLACNYAPTVTLDDSSCVYPVIWQQSYLICDGDSIVVGNNIYDTAGVYMDTLSGTNGCDSIIHTYLDMSTALIWQQSYLICDGDSVIIGASIYDTIGNYIDTLIAGNGCDSIIHTNISIASPSIWYQTYLICDGDSIAVGNNIYDTAGVYMDTLNTSNGCDSVVHTYLMIDENTSSYDTLSVGASIVWNGMPLNVSGDYSVTLINSVGCDSIVNLNLTVTTTGISDIANSKSNLVKITDMLGQETPYRRNTPLFYIYDDGTVEKRIIIE